MKVSVQNISKSFGSWELFSDFSLEIDSGVRLCVCGANGCGKSTFLRMVAGKISTDAGKITFPKQCRMGFVEQELDEKLLDTPLLTWVLDVLPDWNSFWQEWEAATAAHDETALQRLGHRQAELEHIYGYNPEHRAESVLTGLGFSEKKWSSTLRELSGGWRERAKLARVLTAGADVLLLDEPTNHLDLDAVEWLESFLMDYKGALIFVAHDRVFMDKVGTHILYLGGSKPLFRKGSFTQFLTIHEENEARKEQEMQRMSEEVERKMDFVRRFQYKATKARQATSRKRQIEKIEKELQGISLDSKRKNLSFSWPEPARADKTVLSVVDIEFSFPDGTTLWPRMNFQLYRGQKIALVGHNGCGKSTLLKIIAGRLAQNSGAVVTGNLVRMGYFSQHQLETLNPNSTVLSEIRRLSDPHTTEEELMSVLGLFLLGQNYFERPVYELSGGEKSRLMLATLFLARCNFLLLDEPTNHLDLESREALVEALDNYPGTLLMVAHDRHLLSEAADQVWELSSDGFTVHEGGYDEWNNARMARKNTSPTSLLAAELAQTEAQSGAGAGSLAGYEAGAQVNTNLSREEQKRVKREQAELRNTLHRELKPKQAAYTKLEAELEANLAEQAELEAVLALPETYADSKKTSELLCRFRTVQDEGERLMEALSVVEAEIAEIEKKRAELL